MVDLNLLELLEIQILFLDSCILSIFQKHYTCFSCQVEIYSCFVFRIPVFAKLRNDLDCVLLNELFGNSLFIVFLTWLCSSKFI